MTCLININVICCTLVVLLQLLRTNLVFCFNIEERQPIVKRGEQGSYFGFSVAQHIEQQDSTIKNAWILVGAPLGNNSQPQTTRSGALFKCPIGENSNDCEQVETDGKRLTDFDYSDNPNQDDASDVLLAPGADEIKDGQWLGVTVRSQKPGGKVMVCAHRYIQSPNLSLHHYGLGLCYSLKNDLEVEEDLQPCKGRPVEKLHQQYGFCQVGTSLALLDDGFALMGSPGPFTWRGTIFGKEIVGAFMQKDMTTYRGPLNDDAEPIEKYSYLGMSVAGGHFVSKNFISYASGAPRSKLFGEVFFFERKKYMEELNIAFKITGEQFASSFGYEILAMDLNNDGLDDLLVGAPFYYENNVGGAVYIYTNLDKCKSSGCNYTTVLKGKHESRFGFSMTSLGDINKDGFVDVAIGAPYEDNTGAVYIYLGSKDGLTFSQVIKYPVNRQLKTIGYSLSGGLDMDGNGYPDLLVGAYDSDMAILYRTREIIDIKINVKGKELQNINATKKGCEADPSNTNNTCFTFETCFRIYNYKGTDAKNKLKVKYEIKELPNNKRPSRIWFKNEINRRDSGKVQHITVTDPKSKNCQRETVYIHEGIGDILTPIKFQVNYSLANDTPNSPILNTTSVHEFEASFQKSCGDDDKCESELILDARTQLNLTDDGYIFDLGTNNEFLLEANIRNDGESAYEAKLFVIHPEAFSYIALQSDKNKSKSVINCSYKNNTLVICDLGNPFQEKHSATIRLRFEVKNTLDQKVDLKVFVNSTSIEKSTQTSSSFTVILQKIADYTIEGKATTPHLVFGGEVKGQSGMRFLQDIGARVTHTYQLINHGQWPLENMVVTIRWPYQVNPNNNHQDGKWLLYLEDTPVIFGDKENYCYVTPADAVNRLNLNSSGIDSGEPENFTSPSSYTESPANVRRKRDVDDVVKAEMKPEADGKQRKVVTMDCNKKTAKCAKINCLIKKLYNNDPITIQINSRIWNSTLVEDYSNVDWVSIRSVADVVLKDSTTIHSNTSVGTTGVETIFYPSRVLASSGLNIWIIIGSALLGFLLLIILIVILYKVGFFKRNRVKDQTLSGNLQKSDAEQENLLKTKGGSQQ